MRNLSTSSIQPISSIPLLQIVIPFSEPGCRLHASEHVLIAEQIQARLSSSFTKTEKLFCNRQAL
jgi:hypothetical protein